MIAELDMCSRHAKISLKCLCNVDWSLEHSVFYVSNVTKLYGIGLVCIVTGEIRVAAPAALNLHLISKLRILDPSPHSPPHPQRPSQAFASFHITKHVL